MRFDVALVLGSSFVLLACRPPRDGAGKPEEAEAPDSGAPAVDTGTTGAGDTGDTGPTAAPPWPSWGFEPRRFDPPAPFVEVGAGFGYACARDALGLVQCWGREEDGATEVPPGTYQALSVGYDTNCALDMAGEVVCWGDAFLDYDGVPPAEPPPGPFVSIEVGTHWACAMRVDRTMACWGYWPFVEALTWSPDTEFMDLDVDALVCVVHVDGRLECQGTDPGPYYEWEDARVVPAGTDYRKVDCYGDHCCALDGEGVATCWGGDPGTGEYMESQNVPPEGARFSDVCAGTLSGCGVQLDGTLACWYDVPEYYAQTWAIPTVDYPPPAGTYSQVACGSEFWCAVSTEGTVACWGNPTAGRLEVPDP